MSSPLVQGNMMAAIEYYHKALGLRSEDSICAQLLQEDCLKHQANSSQQIIDVCLFAGHRDGGDPQAPG